jgi:hypothetical protein
VTDQARLTPVGYHDLLRDLGQPGCPVCRGAARAAARYLDAVLWEMVTDPGVRHRFRAAHGLCREHASLLLRVASRAAQAAGVAIMFQDFLRHVEGEVEALASGVGPRRRRRDPAAELRPHAPCPACEPARRTAEAYLRLLGAEAAGSPVGRAARSRGRGLCLPHLIAGVELAGPPEHIRRLAEIFLRGEVELREELSSFVRKHDHRFRGEPTSEVERSSWIRAVHRLAGAPPREDGSG